MLFLFTFLLSRSDRSERGDVVQLVGLAVAALIVIGVVVIPGMKGVVTDALKLVGDKIAALN